MNRFRQLKDKLIKSKRDSQKLQQLPFSQTELEDWVEKQLEYYGISKDSYRLKELNNYTESGKYLAEVNKQNPEHMSSKESVNNNKSKENAFVKKLGYISAQQNMSNFHNDMSFGQESYGYSKQSKQQEQSQINNQSDSQASSKRLICKKPKNYHVSSMNDAQQLIEMSTKQKDTQLQQQQNHTKNMFKSYQPQTSEIQCASPHKQLDYYTLILQLTAELNYSRMNKESSNEKSILNQIKDLIFFIEGKSASEGATQPSAQQHSHTNNKPESQQSHQHTNIKSNHTFSSVFSNESMNNEIDHHEKSSGSSEKRRIKYKLIGEQIDREYDLSHKRMRTEPKSSQRNQHQDEHNDTFQSINAFEENDDDSEEEQDKTSIIDMVNDQQHTSYREDIFIQESQDNQNSMIQNSPLSRITQRQSEYTESANPSIHVSPSKYTPDKFTKTTQKPQNRFLPYVMEKHIQSLYAQNIFKKQSSTNSDKEPSSQYTKMMPQNQLILQKLSDRLDNTEESHHLFQQSIEYKRILYMLDSEYGNSDYKNRTFSSLFGGQKSSSTLNQCSSEKDNCQYSIKGASEESVKSFAKQIFQSDESCTKHNHTKQSPCLMSKLDNLFKSQCKKETSSPKMLHFSSENELESHNKQKQRNFIKNKNHKRSQTAKEPFSNQLINKNCKYRFNVLSELSQQINEESQENAFDNNKYEPIRTEYNDDDSVYHKVSRHSYLTSSSAQNSNEPTSSESQCMDGNRKVMRKGNLIVKKNKKSQKISQKQNFNMIMVKSSDEDKLQKSMKFIVKKKLSSNNMQSKDSQQQFNHDISNNSSELFTKRPDSQQVIFISMSNEATSRINHQSSKSIQSHNNSSSSQSSNEKNLQEISYTNNKVLSPSMNESKVSMNSSNRQIKYKVYSKPSDFEPIHQKQDKRKVLKDIVSVLNTKYNRNIKLKQ